eukprot:2173625-Pyramimonas_sp.AAC.1
MGGPGPSLDSSLNGHLCRWVPSWRPRTDGGLVARSSPQPHGAVGETPALWLASRSRCGPA